MNQAAHARSTLVGKAAVVLATVIVPFIWWSALLGPMRPGGTVTLLSYDMYQYTLPDWTFAAATLRAGILPLWNPYQLCGTPFFATQNHGLAYPPNWLILLLPAPEVMRLLTFAHVAWAMGGAYWCARVFGVARAAALLAGVAYAFSGRVSDIAAVTDPSILVSVAWLPWQLGLTRAAVARRARWQGTAALLGVAVAMVLFGGHPQYVLMSAQLCVAYAGAHWARQAWRDGAWPATRAILRLGLAVAVAIGVSAVQLLPTAELTLRSMRAPGALASAAANNPLPYLLPPAELGRSLLYPRPEPFGLAGEGYVGTAALALAAVSLCVRPLRSRACFLVLVALGAIALALGDATPLYQWSLRLPAASLFRVPQRFIILTALSLALLGALGADVLRRCQPPVRAAKLLLLGASVPLGIWLVLRWTTPVWDQVDAGASSSLARHAGVFFMACLPLVSAGHRLRMSWRNGLLVVIAAASALELYRAAYLPVPIPANHPEALQVPQAPAAYLTHQGGFARVFAPNRPAILPGEIPPKLGMLTGLSLISDYEHLVEARYARLLDRLVSATPRMGAVAMGDVRLEAVEPRQWPLLRMLGVGFILQRRRDGVAVPLSPPVYRDDDYDVFELPQALPRTYVAAHVRVEPIADRALAAVAGDTDFILQRGVVVERPVGGDLNGAGSVDITRYGPQVVELRAQLSQPGLVVLNDAFDPYWVATVDGQPTDIWRANYVFRAVAAGAGEHTIRFEYRPTLVYAGAIVSLASLALLAAGAIMCRRRADLLERRSA